MGGTRNRGRASRPWIAPAVLLLAAASASGQEAPPNTVYEYETSLAPVCVDGSFPLTIEVPGAPAAGTLVALGVILAIWGGIAGWWTTRRDVHVGGPRTR